VSFITGIEMAIALIICHSAVCLFDVIRVAHGYSTLLGSLLSLCTETECLQCIVLDFLLD
jgi:hypothetical protein